MNKTAVIISLVIIVLSGNKKTFRQADKPQYTSAVPKYTFSKTLFEQEEELKLNPIVQRFAESYKKLSVESYMPIYHFSNLETRQALCASVRPNREDSKSVSNRTQGGAAELIS
jgi:hypothetical protein